MFSHKCKVFFFLFSSSFSVDSIFTSHVIVFTLSPCLPLLSRFFLLLLRHSINYMSVASSTQPFIGYKNASLFYPSQNSCPLAIINSTWHLNGPSFNRLPFPLSLINNFFLFPRDTLTNLASFMFITNMSHYCCCSSNFTQAHLFHNLPLVAISCETLDTWLSLSLFL